MSNRDIVALLTAPRRPFETRRERVHGIEMTVWVNTPRNIPQILETSVSKFSERTFLVYDKERMTFGEHYAAVARFAGVLGDKYAIKTGDRVALCMRNYPEWSVAFWAITALGAIAVPLNAWWTAPELEYGLKDSGSCLLIADNERIERLRDRLESFRFNGIIVSRWRDPAPAGVDRYEELMAKIPAGGKLPDVDIAPDDDATIFYTSGTTGNPKGALGSHRNFCTSATSVTYIPQRHELRHGRTPSTMGGPVDTRQRNTLISVPFFHVTGCISLLMGSVVNGTKLVMMYKWDPEKALQLIEEEKINNIGGVPTIAWQIIESPHFQEYDTSSIERVSYGGAPAAPELVNRIAQTFPSAMPSMGYGMTETSAITTSHAGDDYRRKPHSCGMAVPILEIKIVDEAGKEVPRGQLGEIMMKGPSIIKGYWNKPEATAKTITPEGWLHSGDLGYLDEDDCLYIADRAKDMLIRGGENIYCSEIENVLYAFPGVMDAAVIGKPHPSLGETVAAVVQLKPAVVVTEAQLIAQCRKELAPFKVPEEIQIRREPLPRNANGKILKRQLKEELGYV
jgi:long-chain acyl-CoA synthetase